MKAAIYARKSTGQSGISDEQRSVARQVEHAHSYATRKGWRVLDDTFTSMTASAAPSSPIGLASYA